MSGGLVFALCVLECAYRLKVFCGMPNEHEQLTYRVCSDVYIEYDKQHGERFHPNSEHWVTFVENGTIVFGTTCSRSNANGLGGRTTIGEFAERNTKVLVFGDSFTHWNQSGKSWPDILEEELGHRLGKTVGVLNYARGAYGVTQMLTLAAEKAREHKPDLVIIAAIADDFTRSRWWCKQVEWQGHTRWMISSRNDEFQDYRVAVDEFLINEKADRRWCERMQDGTATSSDHAILEETNQQFATIRSEVFKVRRNFSQFTIRKSYLYSRLTRGTPFEYASHVIPRVSFEDFADDDELVHSIRSLRDSGCPTLMVYLPQKPEIDESETAMPEQAKQLMHSLERLMHQPFVLLHKESNLTAPAIMDLKPYDGHPNISGLRWYAKAVAPIAKEWIHPEETR